MIQYRKILTTTVMAMCLFCMVLPAKGKDSGDENVVPVIQWECWYCDKHFYSFAPDSLDGKKSANNKDFRFQQQNWLMFYDASKSIPKCDRSADGSHFFDEGKRTSTSPFLVARTRDRFVVLKSSGTLNVPVIKWRCIGCDKEGFSFKGDDLDLHDGVNWRDSHNLFSMRDGNRITDCKLKVANFQSKIHIITITSEGSTTSYNLAKSVQNVWYSN